MAVIQPPPNWREIFSRSPQEILPALLRPDVKRLTQESNERYLYWSDFRHRPMPESVRPEIAWTLLKLARSVSRRDTTLFAPDGMIYWYWLPDSVLKYLHRIDQSSSGHILTDAPMIHKGEREKYIAGSLMEEAISSSLLEGAATTRKVAKEMIRTGRKPATHGEQMVLNNYQTMKRVHDLGKEPLTPELLCELQECMTRNTLADPDMVGRFRLPGDEPIVVVDNYTQQILYTPPDAAAIPTRIRALCDYANSDPAAEFTHPVVKAIILHFWLAYEHPFNDGNGRTARALFYWYLLKQGYWLFEFIPISRMILRSPGKYKKAFLQTETDEGDLTYFIHFHLRAIYLTVNEVTGYIERKQREVLDLERRLKRVRNLNHRELELLNHALHHPDEIYNIEKHVVSQNVAYETARTDLMHMVKLGYFKIRDEGRRHEFVPHERLARKLGM
jgi:Fic family protein